MSARRLNQAPAPAEAAQKNDPDPTGFLCNQWVSFEERPALILNPDADVGHVLAWCWAEVKVLEVTARNFINAGSAGVRMIDAEEMDALFSHRLQPLERVLHHLCSTLDKSKKQREQV